jgi:hypothetical protein
MYYMDVDPLSLAHFGISFTLHTALAYTHCTALHCTALHCTALHWLTPSPDGEVIASLEPHNLPGLPTAGTLHCTANCWHCTLLHCTALHCTAHTLHYRRVASPIIQCQANQSHNKSQQFIRACVLVSLGFPGLSNSDKKI